MWKQLTKNIKSYAIETMTEARVWPCRTAWDHNWPITVLYFFMNVFCFIARQCRWWKHAYRSLHLKKSLKLHFLICAWALSFVSSPMLKWGWGKKGLSSEQIKEHTGNLHSESEHEHASLPIISLDSKYSRDVTPPPRRLHVSSYRRRMWHNCTRSKKLWFACSRAVLEGAGLQSTPTINNKQQEITNYLKPEQCFAKMSGFKADKIKQQIWWTTCALEKESLHLHVQRPFAKLNGLWNIWAPVRGI